MLLDEVPLLLCSAYKFVTITNRNTPPSNIGNKVTSTGVSLFTHFVLTAWMMVSHSPVTLESGKLAEILLLKHVFYPLLWHMSQQPEYFVRQNVRIFQVIVVFVQETAVLCVSVTRLVHVFSYCMDMTFPTFNFKISQCSSYGLI